MGIILTPFAWLLMLFYDFSQNYGIALILFALVIKLVLFPFNLKGKKSMIQMNLLSSKMQQLQKQYGKDRERYNLEIQKLYEKEKVNPMSGCLWSFIPIIFLMVLYGIIREPLTYLMNVPADMIETVAEITGVANSGTYPQIAMLKAIADPAVLEQVKAALGDAGAGLFSMNVEFLGINLANIPQLNFWSAEGGLVWGNIGLFLLPLVSVGTSLLSMYVSMKTNQMNRGGEQNEQMAKTNRTMMIFMPIMSLWIGFTMPAALCVYWIANNLLSMLQEFICGRLLKKDYEKAAAAQAERERLEKEEEKEERRRKAEERARRIEEAKLNKGKKKKTEKKKDEDDDKIPGSVKENSRVGMRQYARGRAYDPYRYSEDGPTPYPGEEPIFPPRADSRELKREAREVEEELRELRTDEAIEETILTGEIPAPETDSQPDAQPGEAPAPQAEESAPKEGGDDTKTDGESGK